MDKIGIHLEESIWREICKPRDIWSLDFEKFHFFVKRSISLFRRGAL